MAWSRDFQKCIIFYFLDKFFLQTFLLYYRILQIIFFANFNFFADSKSRAKGHYNDVSIVIFRHQTCDLRDLGGGGYLTPPDMS